jgi:gliding motility-associated-like protein
MKGTLLPFLTCAFFLTLLAPVFSQKGSQPFLIRLENNRLRQPLSFAGSEQEIRLCGLKKGETYQLWAVQSDVCHPTVRLATEKKGSRHLEFVAEQECQELVFQKDLSPKNCTGELFLSIACKSCLADKNQKSLKSMLANLSVSYGAPTQLIKDVFIGGNCFDVSNVTPIGSSNGMGTFDNGGASIIINDGVILSSGDINNAPGPNNSGSAGNSLGGAGSDPDLNSLGGGNLFDIVGIEFDFRPTLNMVEFEYVFASEEYCEWVGSQFNDVFGFFISGPGISGPYSNNGINISVLPGTATPVAINNVNHITNSNLFFPNDPGSCGAATNMNDIQFDGWTTILTAKANVIPCSTYHIRLLIADRGDAIYDSAVFLNANSFDAGGNATAEAYAPSTNSNFAYEGCSDGSFIFTRAGGNPNLPVVVNFTILPSSTATPGVDYAPIPTTIVIPPGATTFTLPVTVFADNIVEGDETIVISLTNSCSCSSLQVTLTIKEPPPLQATLEDMEVCAGTPISLTPDVSGGIPDYNYQWSNGMNTPSLLVVASQSQTYTVTVTDNCGGSTVTTSNVQVSEVPTAIISGGGLICAGNASVPVTIDFTGTGPWEFVYTIDGSPIFPPIVTTQNPYTLTASVPGAYGLQSVMTVIGQCIGPAVGVAPVLFVEINVATTTTPNSCVGNGSVTANPTGGVSPYSYTWSNGAPNQPTANNLPAGTYTVTVTDSGGCTGTASATVTSIPPVNASATAPTQASCANPNGGSINVTVSGGQPGFTYAWSGGLPATQNQTGLAAGTYTVTVTDNTGCSVTASATVTSNNTPPIAVANASGTLTCDVLNTGVSGTGSSTGANFTYQWSGPGVTAGGNTLNATVNLAGTYTLLVTNTANGCTTDTTVAVNSNTTPPDALAAGGTLSCTDTVIAISGAGSSSGAGFTYQWSGPGILSGGTTLTPNVNQSGNYTLVVTDVSNGCTQSASATVNVDDATPTAVIAPPPQLTCTTTNITLNGSGSSSGANYSYQWVTGAAPIPGATSNTLDVNAAGTYQLVVTNQANGCKSSTSVTVSQNVTPPIVSANANGMITCNQTTTGLTAVVSGNPANYTYQWTTANGNIYAGANSATPTVDQPGVYTVLVTGNANGCTNTASVTVQQDATIPQVVLATPAQLDCITKNVMLDATGSSQGGTISITWTTQDGSFVSAQNTLTPVVNAPGTYTLTINDSSNSCETVGSVVVTQDITTPDVVLPVVPALTCATTSVSIGATVPNLPASGLTYSWNSLDGVLDTPADSLVASVSNPGTYTLLVTNTANGCTDQASVTILQNTTPPTVAIATPDQLTCANTTVGLSGTGSSTGNNFTYQWTTADGNLLNGATTLNPVVNEPGTYQLLITNTANGCTQTAQTTVSEDVVTPSANAGAPMTLTCTNTQLTLGGTGSTGGQFSYQWTTANGYIVSGATSLTPSVNLPGTYQLLVTNLTNQCTAVSSVDVGQDVATPVANAGQGGELSCTVTQMVLDGGGSSAGNNFAYAWTTPGGNIVSGANTLTPAINAPGNYTLVVTNTTNGCTASASVQITEDDDLPMVNAGMAQPLTCLVNSVTLDGSGSASGPNFTYQWSTANGNIVSGTTTLNPVVSAAGIYVLTVTNTATNCTNLGSVTVVSNTAPPLTEAGQAQELTCTVQSLTLNGAGSATGVNFTYQWSTTNGIIVSGANTLNPVVGAPGAYSLMVTNTTTGCTNTDMVMVNESVDLPSAAASVPGLLTCTVKELTLSGAGSSTGNDFAYTWTSANGSIVSGNNTLSLVVNQPGTYQLQVSNTLNGCTKTVEVDVLQDIASPAAEAGTAAMLTCTVESLTLNGAGSSTGNGFSYVWTTINGNIVSGANSLTPVVNQPGNYVLLVTNTANGCTKTDNVLVQQDDSVPTATLAPPAKLTCVTKTVTLNATASQGADFQYQWTTTGGNILSGANTLAPQVNAPGTYNFVVTNSLNGCSKSVQTTVTQDVQAPVAEAGSAFIMDCFQDVHYLDGGSSTGNSTLSFVWSSTNGSIVSGGNSATPGVDKPGTYLLTVTNLGNGCTDTDEVILTRDGPAAEPLVTQPPCYGDKGAIQISNVAGGTPPYLYSLDGGQNFGTKPNFLQLPPAMYAVVVQDAKGCEFKEEILVEQPVPLNISVETEATIQLGDTYQITTLTTIPADQLSSVTWSPATGLSCTDCLDPIATPLTSTVYKVKVVTLNGCKDDAVILIKVNKKGGVYVPNAFSPNGDGTNDIFMIYSDNKSVAKVKSFLVFNRWGETVFQYYNFEPNNPAFGWDGKHRNDELNPAVFAWFAEIEFVDGRTELFEGDVALMR